ncbi:CocE/NonD family hydrolase [Phenylobacterium sp.]|uniref:CocE/NonD family hydrolase n=1 Tax=Phenylobacterium sp. TaxID=1871053 RepID=UPI002F3E9F72
MKSRRLGLAVSVCAAVALPLTLRAQAPAPIETADLAVAATARSLIAAHPDEKLPADLTRLYRLQLAAGLYAEADATMARLETLYRSSQPGRADALVPWRIYSRAKQHERAGASPSKALDRAFAELYASLPDKRMADVLPWYGANLDQLEATYAPLARACGQPQRTTCASAADWVTAYQALATWRYLWPASAPLIRADAERRFRVDDRLLVPTPDGAKIAVMLVRPKGDDRRKRTALLNFTIYANDNWSFSDAVKMAAYGYAGVVAYTRGKGRSPDPVVPYVHDGADAATVIDWLAKQPWSDGRVGMFSGSYNASTQWAAAKHRPKALKAIATNASNAPGIDTPMQGNVFQSFIYPWPFYTTDNKGLDDRTYGETSRWEALGRKWYASGRPYRDLDKIDGTPNPVFDTWLDHPSYDAYWQRLIPYREEFAKVDIPVFVETGYYDGGMVGALYYLEQHYRYRPSADHRLLVGPYHHTAMQTGVLPIVDGYEVDRAALIDLQDVRLKWFDHVFHGAPLPAILSDRINFEVMGANRWRHVPSLDAMADARLRLYLTDRREGERRLFSQTAPGAQPQLRLSVDFADRNDVDRPAPANGLDTRNALVFTTAPMTRPTEVDGLFEGRFAIVANKRDFDLAVDFYDQRADGRVLPLASYLGRVSYMEDRSHRRLLQPGRPRTLAFQSQTITARLVAAGDRIIAVVGVPKRPDTEINYGTGGEVAAESIADAREPLEIRWRAGSYLQLGLRRSPPGQGPR